MIWRVTRVERVFMHRLRGVVIAVALSSGLASTAWAQPSPPLRAQTPRVVFPLARGRAAPPPATTPTEPPLAANEARLLWMHGAVEITGPDAQEGARPGRVGEVLPRGVRITVGEQGGAEVLLANGTQLSLEERTQVLLFASPLATPQGMPASTATTLVHGAARIRMNPIQSGEGAALLPVAIGTATAFVGRVDGRIVYEHLSHIARLAANRGRMRVRTPEREYILRAGNGALEEPGHPRQPYRQLPPQPQWVTPPPERLLSSGEALDVSASYGLRGSTVAAEWRVELARDESFHDVVTSARVPGETTTWSARALPPGHYAMRVTALDNDHFESLPSSVARVHIAAPRLVEGVGPGGAAPPRLAALHVPEGFFCGVDGARAVATNVPLRLSPGRRHQVRCASTPDGTDVREIAVSAEQSGPLVREVRVRSTGLDAGVLAVRLFDAEGQALPYADVTVTNDRGVQVDRIREARERGVYNASMRWPRGVTRARFRFTVNGADSFEQELTQGD
jgi:hypothetical protein